MTEFIGQLVLAEAIRTTQPTLALEEVLRVEDGKGSLFVHLAPASDTPVEMPKLNNALARLVTGLVRLGRPDIMVFRQTDGYMCCGRVVCGNIVVCMYPARWIAKQISGRLPCPLAQTVIAGADLMTA